jgi:hypothetical protein
MATILREAVQPSIGYVRGYPGRDEDQCSSCGRFTITLRVLTIHTRHRNDRYLTGWKEDSQLDAQFVLCDTCYFTVIQFMMDYGMTHEVNPLKGYK